MYLEAEFKWGISDEREHSDLTTLEMQLTVLLLFLMFCLQNSLTGENLSKLYCSDSCAWTSCSNSPSPRADASVFVRCLLIRNTYLVSPQCYFTSYNLERTMKLNIEIKSTFVVKRYRYDMTTSMSA